MRTFSTNNQIGISAGSASGAQASTTPTTYTPCQIAGITLQFDSDTAADLATAETAIRKLNVLAGAPKDAKVLADALLRVEIIASLKMDGRQVNTEQLFRDEVTCKIEEEHIDTTPFAEAFRNANALQEAFVLADGKITPKTFETIHRHFLAGTTRKAYSGVLRTEQTKVGGSRYHSFGTPDLLPAPEEIPSLLEDLAQFCSESTLPAIAQAALAHAQFINIHPFARGNGKVARALIQLILRRRGVAPQTPPPLSVALALSPHDYIAGIAATRFDKNALPSQEEALNTWFRYFSSSCLRAVKNAQTFKSKIEVVENGWRDELAPRAGSATSLLISALPCMPVFSASTASEFIGRSFKRTGTAIDQLVEAGIVEQVNQGGRNRIFEAHEIIDIYTKIDGFQ